MKKPIIGVISAKHEESLLPVYRTSAHYPEQVADAGGIPMQLPLLPGMSDGMMDAMLAICDGFLLPGGADFDSDWYGESLLPGLLPDDGALSRESQETALRFIRKMVSSGKPMLGICLGVQVINVAMGGSLYQDIPSQKPSEVCHRTPVAQIEDRWQMAHTVTTAEGSLLRGILGAEVTVNSFHHQAVKDIAPGFTASAWSPEGLVEAIESENGRILGVQWHPENLAHAGIPHAKALFSHLVRMAAEG